MNTEPAKWWTPLTDHSVQCDLCPRKCTIPEGTTGFCGVRENRQGKLYSLAYGRPVSIAIDPIEKKPLARFMPRTETLSFGTFGCNLGCTFCQNHTLSRKTYGIAKYDEITPAQIVKLAFRHGCPSISFTYNEPTVFAEYVMDTAQEARKSGLKNVLVSNGYISNCAADEIYPLIDAANIDMKGFSQDFYREMCAGELNPILDSLEKLYALNVHLEITTLIIPGKNDDDDSITGWLEWVASHLDKTVPLHFNAYHPAYNCRIQPTEPRILYHIKNIAAKMGFANVFLGNI